MSLGPKTKADAEAFNYGSGWQTVKYDPKRCAALVYGGDRGASRHQCRRSPGHGTDRIFCRLHDPVECDRLMKDQLRKYNEKIEHRRIAEVLRGLRSATVEQLRDELARREKEPRA